MILALFLMAQEAPAQKPEPLRPQTWITDDDYPAGSLRRGEYGKVRFALAVAATGVATQCRITWTSGFAELDQTACAILLKRARFKPARDATGKAIPALYSSSFSWEIPGGGPKAQDAPAQALSVSINKVPKGYARPSLLRVHFSSAGKPDSCRVEMTSGNVALDKIACEQAMAQATVPTARINGGSKPDTEMMEVSFEASAGE